jgi:hypothetical protein
MESIWLVISDFIFQNKTLLKIAITDANLVFHYNQPTISRLDVKKQ